MTMMRSIPALAAAGLLALPAASGAHGKPVPPSMSHNCKSHAVGYVVSGTLAAPATLTQTRGADTPADTSDDRYSGTLSITVTRASHHAKGATQPQTFEVASIRLGKGVTATPAAGTKVQVIGKITKISKRCDQAGAGVVTARKAILRASKA
jgi:hypothetical protein